MKVKDFDICGLLKGGFSTLQTISKLKPEQFEQFQKCYPYVVVPIFVAGGLVYFIVRMDKEFETLKEKHRHEEKMLELELKCKKEEESRWKDS